MPQNVFVGPIAEFYDTTSTEMYTPAVLDPTVDFLADLNEKVGGGRVLELGIGTGRVGLPLTNRGVNLRGIEISTDMVAQLKAKPGADRVGVTVGDFATAKMEGAFTLALLVFNTISNLLTQDEQVECFKNVAEHLEPGIVSSFSCGSPNCKNSSPVSRSAPSRRPPSAWDSTSMTWPHRGSLPNITG